MLNDILIRIIELNDAKEISILSNELGYQIEKKEIQQQIISIIEDDKHFAFVAVYQNEIVGFIHGFVAIRLTSLPFLEISGLVVKEDFRQDGIGTKLVTFLEENVSNVKSVRVRCNENRLNAHNFYLKFGYTENKTQKIFQKNF